MSIQFKKTGRDEEGLVILLFIRMNTSLLRGLKRFMEEMITKLIN